MIRIINLVIPWLLLEENQGLLQDILKVYVRFSVSRRFMFYHLSTHKMVNSTKIITGSFETWTHFTDPEISKEFNIFSSIDLQVPLSSYCNT